MAPSVGIDLGTTFSVVAWVNADGDPEVIPDMTGARLTASVVGFAEGIPVVGEVARNELATGGREVASFFKSSMGDPAYRPWFAGRGWSATDLSALVLAHLKEQAEGAIGAPVTEAVITVPEYFTHPQRSATIEAGRRAGLEVRRIISEPTAAALAYGMQARIGAHQILVYDLGGGTFDVSVIRLGADSIEVIAAAGDHELGGRDWDDRLALHLQRRFCADTGIDVLLEDPGELLAEVEQVKRALSARYRASARVGSRGQAARYPVTRPEFEALTTDLLDRTAQLTEQALGDAGLTWNDIAGVLPVGGSTRMPMVRAWIEQISGRPPIAGIHPDEAVALGAAIQAALIQPGHAHPGARLVSRKTSPVRLGGLCQVQDIVAHSLGMIAESPDRSRYVNSVLLHRNTPVPCEAPRPYQFDVRGDGEDMLDVFLTQGESDDPAECTFLGRYAVTGFPAKPAGPAVLDITFAYDENAVVTVTAADRDTRTPLTVRVDALPPDVPSRFLGPPSSSGVHEPTTVYLAFDLSGSMSGAPLARAQRAADAFVSQLDLSTTSVGMISFSDRVHVELTASQNPAAITMAIDDLVVGRTGYGNNSHPFDHLHDLLSCQPGRRYAVVLADGIWAGQDRAVKRAQRCHQQDIQVIAIGFGAADRMFLDKIASSTEQALFIDLKNLSQAFSRIARELTGGTQHLVSRSRLKPAEQLR